MADEEHTSRFGREAGDLGPVYGICGGRLQATIRNVTVSIK